MAEGLVSPDPVMSLADRAVAVPHLATTPPNLALVGPLPKLASPAAAHPVALGGEREDDVTSGARQAALQRLVARRGWKRRGRSSNNARRAMPPGLPPLTMGGEKEGEARSNARRAASPLAMDADGMDERERNDSNPFEIR